MPKARKRKTPIVVHDSSQNSGSTSKSSRTVIRQFHVLLKRQAQLERQPTVAANKKELQEIQTQIDALGGLEVYQRMSAIGQGEDRGGGSEKVLIGWLKELGIRKANEQKLRLLEVGALKPDNYRKCLTWIDPTPIDLRTRHPAILEQDFLLLDEAENEGKWDLISLSLVVNFVPDAKDRGRMLCLSHMFLAPEGYLFLVLPLPCVANSRYLDFDSLQEMMKVIGFEEVKNRWKEGGKVAYWLYKKSQPANKPMDQFQSKTVVRTGNRNNFCILL